MKQYENKYVENIKSHEDEINKVIALMEESSKESRKSAAPNLRLALLMEQISTNLETLKVVIEELEVQKRKDAGL